MLTDESIRAALEDVARRAPDARAVRGRLTARTRTVGRRRLVLAGAGLAVVVAAGVAGAGLLGTDTKSGSGAATGTLSGSSGASTVLLKASLAARQEQVLPARPDQYVFIESISQDRAEGYTCDGQAHPSSCAAAGGSVATRTRRIWLSADGTHDGLLSERPRTGNGPWTTSTLSVCAAPSAAPGRDAAPGNAAPACAGTPDPAYRVDLPTNADAMLAYLGRQAAGPAKGDAPGDARLFTAAGDLIRENYVPPAALAAVFAALAKVPGITVTQGVVDAAGRAGVAVGYDINGYRNELVFDPRTYDFLANRTVALRDVDGEAKGSVTFQLARLRISIVDRPGQVPA